MTCSISSVGKAVVQRVVAPTWVVAVAFGFGAFHALQSLTKNKVKPGTQKTNREMKQLGGSVRNGLCYKCYFSTSPPSPAKRYGTPSLVQSRRSAPRADIVHPPLSTALAHDIAHPTLAHRRQRPDTASPLR